MEKMLRDDNNFPPPVGEFIESADIAEDRTTSSSDRVYGNNDFDDVWGSAPSSPISDLHEFGDENTSAEAQPVSRSSNIEVSDIPRLKEKHETEGYRDGVTLGKAKTVQAGFDEGYTLGAVLGLKIGRILGLLEAVWSSVLAAKKTQPLPDNSASKIDWVSEEQRLALLLNEAKQELKTQNVFGKEWWSEDGIWKYEVKGERENEGEVLFPDVAASHPLVIKWEGVLAAEVHKWGLDLTLMEGNEDDEDGYRLPEKKAGQAEQATIMGVATKQELSW